MNSSRTRSSDSTAATSTGHFRRLFSGHWTIRRRITTCLGLILSLVAIQSTLTLFKLRSMQGEVHTLTVESLPGLVDIGNVQRNAGEIQILVLRLLLPHTEGQSAEYVKAIDALSARNSKLTDAFKTNRKGAEIEALFAAMIERRDNYRRVRAALIALVQEGRREEALEFNASALRPAFNTFEESLDALAQRTMAEGLDAGSKLDASANLTVKAALVSAAAVLFLSLFASRWIVHSLGRVLGRVAASLEEGSNQVAAAAAQVAASSQSLAEGASEQAASLEETSSSLEEMSSMTKRNSESAAKANTLARDTRTAADAGAMDMQAMKAAMQEIKQSSDDIAKIVKTIDEIAFQTNILALNAAVEAARAGTAGAGFAVVADEVRALAQRSAIAARETADKIDGAIVKTTQGVEISEKVALSLGQIVERVRQVDQLITDVSTASGEQTIGVSQINTTVGQMDKVVQGAASTAEETAAAAEELHGQAGAMRDSVTELVRLLGNARRS